MPDADPGTEERDARMLDRLASILLLAAATFVAPAGAQTIPPERVLRMVPNAGHITVLAGAADALAWIAARALA